MKYLTTIKWAIAACLVADLAVLSYALVPGLFGYVGSEHYEWQTLKMAIVGSCRRSTDYCPWYCYLFRSRHESTSVVLTGCGCGLQTEPPVHSSFSLSAIRSRAIHIRSRT